MDGTAIVECGPATTRFRELCESAKWPLLLTQGDLAPGTYIFDVDPRDQDLMRTVRKIDTARLAQRDELEQLAREFR